MSDDGPSGGQIFGTIGGITAVIGIVLGTGMWGCPQYNVYSSRLAGEAELAQASYNQQVLVQTARAQKDSATLLAEKRVIDAKGIAEANDIIAKRLGGPDNYLRFEFIQMLKEHDEKQIIYVPTEAGIPIVEAGRAKK